MNPEFWRYIFDAIEEPVFLHDTQFRVLLANRAYCREAGVTEAEVLGKPYWEVFPPGTGPLPGCKDAVDRKDHDGSQEEVRVGAMLYLSKSYTMRDDQGKLLHALHMMSDITERKKAESRLLESEEKLRAVFEGALDGIVLADAETHRFAIGNPALCRMLGYSPEELTRVGVADIHPQQDLPHVIEQFESQLRGEIQLAANIPVKRKDGSVFYADIKSSPVNLDDKTFLIGIFRDITERKRAEKIIQESTQRLSLHFQQTPLAVIEWDTEFRVVDWNPAAENIFGYTKAQALGHHAMELIVPENAKPHVAQIWENLLTGRSGFRSSNENLTRDGKTIYCEWYNTPLIDADGQIIGVAALAQDVTEQKRATERATYLAYYDDLTGLPNRTLFKDRLSQAFIEADRKERLVGVMFLDIDRFKDVNDTLGHEAGNVLLQAVARRLQGCLRASDTVARFGSDDFAVFFPDVGHVDDVVQVAQHVIDGFKEPFDILGQELFVTCSMGITLYPFDDGGVDNLLRNADSAMYAAKAAGRNCYRFYAAAMTARATERLAMQTGLRRALEHGEFILHYQPQLDIGSNRIIGVEALVRWQHPEKGLISPAQFIPAAEETGLIVPLGEWVLRTACLQAKAWQEQGVASMHMAVNLSARQFKEARFSQRILEIVRETGLDPQYLELEITESILVDGLESVSTVLQEFKQAGIMISLDDFGTGYSSLSYLNRFPIDKLKIDQSFVRDLLTDANDASLVRAIIAMAQALGLRAIAEGVETQGQFDFLNAGGCDEIQGYHIARPLPAEQVADFILQYNSV